MNHYFEALKDFHKSLGVTEEATTAALTGQAQGGTTGGLETGSECKAEFPAGQPPKSFSKGHAAPEGNHWVACGISNAYEGRASARIQDRKTLVVTSTCSGNQLAKYRWWGRYEADAVQPVISRPQTPD